MEILLYKRIVLNLKKVCERWKESKWRIEFGIFIYFLSGSYYNIFIHYNIITLCYTPYLDDYLVMYFKSNHSIMKKKKFIYFKYE